MGYRWQQIALHGSVAGIISGVFLGIMLKLIEGWSGKLVYTLLLNVDFITWLPATIPEWVEFGMHLLVALPLGWLYIAYVSWRGRPWLVGVVVGIVTSITWLPLTMVSERTPATDDYVGLLWWLAGHVAYGVVLGGYGSRFLKTRNGRR